MIRKNVLLACSPAKAFDLFTSRISEWWPTTHRATKDPESLLTLDPGGLLVDRASDGREIAMGRVQAWEPPDRLMLDFYPGTGAAQPTAVEITFVAEGEGTRVTILHQPTPASEKLWHERAHLFVRNWDAVLDALAAA